MKNTVLAAVMILCPIAAHSSEFECLAKNIYFEARGESFEGQEFVAWVTLNRVGHKRYPDTICEVVWQDSQFSWTDNPRSVKEHDAYRYAESVARYVLMQKSQGALDPTQGATMFHATKKSPFWKSSFVKVARVGRHIFYREKKDAGNP